MHALGERACYFKPRDFAELLEVVLFRLPTSGLEAIASNAAAAYVRETVVKYPSWSAVEKQAVLSVMNWLRFPQD
jgi:hypothetical protein